MGFAEKVVKTPKKHNALTACPVRISASSQLSSAESLELHTFVYFLFISLYFNYLFLT